MCWMFLMYLNLVALVKSCSLDCTTYVYMYIAMVEQRTRISIFCLLNQMVSDNPLLVMSDILLYETDEQYLYWEKFNYKQHDVYVTFEQT